MLFQHSFIDLFTYSNQRYKTGWNFSFYKYVKNNYKMFSWILTVRKKFDTKIVISPNSHYLFIYNLNGIAHLKVYVRLFFVFLNKKESSFPEVCQNSQWHFGGIPPTQKHRKDVYEMKKIISKARYCHPFRS